MSNLNGMLESLEWESHFFGLPSAILRLRETAPALTDADFRVWQRVQAKIPADRADLLDALQQHGFQLVEGEVDLAITLTRHEAPGAEVAAEQDIPVLREMAAQAFARSRFRAPWYAPEDSGRFYAQWIENAVKGTFDHVCLVFRAADGPIQGFVSLRKLNERELIMDDQTGGRIERILKGESDLERGCELGEPRARWLLDRGRVRQVGIRKQRLHCGRRFGGD